MSSDEMKPDIKQVEDDDKRSAIMRSIADIDVSQSQIWNELDQLSTHTDSAEIDAVPEGIFEVENNDFEAVATVYVTLNYGDRRDRSSMSDSYPVHVRGTYDKNKKEAMVVDMSVDTSSFYR